MKELDEIIYDALMNDNAVNLTTRGRIFSTCIPIPPDKEDNTPLPYIIITDDPFQNETGTKDDVWESDTDRVQASIEIASKSPEEVKQLRRMVRRAIAAHVATLQDPPYLVSVSNDGIAWDWLKPCYYDRLHYQCDVTIQDDEQEENPIES
jgi:hypothetical protein